MAIEFTDEEKQRLKLWHQWVEQSQNYNVPVGTAPIESQEFGESLYDSLRVDDFNNIE